MEKLIITAAVTGGDTTPSQSPYLPITPKEIAEEAIRCANAGASIVHVHARDPETGRPDSRGELFAEIFSRIKERSDVIICPTTGGNATMTLEERLQLIPRFRPEMATFNLGTMNYSTHFIAESYERREKSFKYEWEREYHHQSKDAIFRNTFADLELFASTFKEQEVKPECEAYDLGMLYTAAYLLERGFLSKPIQLQFVLGVLGGARAEAGVLHFLKSTADDLFGKHDYTWSAVGAGYPNEFHIAAQAIILGGNVRVGMEDNLKVSKNELAKSNAELVEKTVSLSRLLDREIADPDQTRRILGLKGADRVSF